MEDRIQINGIWYRRETGVLTEEETVDLDPCWSRTIVVENKNLCLEASVSCDDVDFTVGKRNYNYINIEVTDKRTKPWKTENWDSETWLLGVHKRLPESLDAFNHIEDGFGPLSMDDRKFAVAFIDYLVEIGWIKE